AFKKTVTEKYLKEQHKIDDIPEHKHLICNGEATIGFEKVISCIAEFYKISENEIFIINKGKFNKARAIAIYLTSSLCQINHVQISTYFNNVSTSAISKSCLRFEARLRKIKILKDEFECIKKRVTETK